MPHILAAPSDNVPVEVLCYRPWFGERVFSDKISLCPEDGVIGDRWKEHSWLKLANGDPDPSNQVCILGRRVLDLIWCDRANTIYPGDTMIIDMNFSEDNLPSGSFIHIGGVVLQVSDVFNDACVKWKKRYGVESYEWLNRQDNRQYRLRGVFCTIIQGGDIQLGSMARILRV